MRRLFVAAVVGLAAFGPAVSSRAIAAPPAASGSADVEKTWISCVEHVPTGASRPELTETFPARGLSGYAAPLEVHVKHGKGETVLPQGFRVQGSSDAAKALEKAGFVLPDPTGGSAPSIESDAKAGGTKVTIPFLLLPKEAGRTVMVLPPVPIAIARASGEMVTVCTKQHTITVEDPVASAVDPKPKPNPPPRPQREHWELAERVAIGALIGAALTLLLAYAYSRYKRRPKPVPYVEPKLPWVLAFEELAALKASSLLADGQTDAFYDGVSDCVRKYLGGRYGFDGLESTTDELRALLRRVRPPVPELARIGSFLADCDLVKFARMVPTETDCLGAFSAGEQIVRDTMPIGPTPWATDAKPPPRRPE